MTTRLLYALYAILALTVLLVFDGTGGEGDSIYHYLYARYAPEHPALFFDHWAKPLYVLIASPFAQAGFIGVKVLNVILVLGTLHFTHLTAQQWNLSSSWLVVLLLIFSPLYFTLTFSGLTEPMFAFFLILATFLWIKKKWFWSLLIISFLPYIRSEGLFFIAIFGVTAIVQGAWKYVPVLLIGSVIYGAAGIPVHHDFLWVFTKVPYAKMSSTYGQGTAFHFIEQLLYVIGIPFYILFWLGGVHWIWKAVRGRVHNDQTLIVYGGVVVFILAHSVFWYWGIFNSMGLKRVLVAIIPYLALIALFGYQFINELLPEKRWFKTTWAALIIAYIVVFPFTANPAAIDLPDDLQRTPKQNIARTIAKDISAHYPERRIVTADVYFCKIMGIDCFDPAKKVTLNHEQLEQLVPGDIIIWENWFAITEQGITDQHLDQHPQLERIDAHFKNGADHPPIHFKVYTVK